MTRRIQWLAFIAGLVVLILVFVLSRQMMAEYANRPIIKREAPVIRPDVSVVTVKTDRYPASISAFGAAEAHFNITLSAQVAGQVETLAANFETGRQLEQGDTLLKLENSDFQAAVAEARQQLAETELLLMQEQRQGRQAAAEWQASGLTGEPDELVLRKPQLAQAEAAVNNAKAQLRSAEKDLQFTEITAPFAAMVVTRDVSPGSFVQAGTQVATLYSTDLIEVSVSLSEREWQSLPDSSQMLAVQWPVNLQAVEGNGQWQGQVLRSEQHLDGTTRQRSLIIGVNQPLEKQPALHPGTFVKATLAGSEQDGLWQLPLTSLSQRGDIWYVNADNQLAKFATTPVFSDADFIYITPPAELAEQTQRVLIQPIDSYLPGMAAEPVEVTDDQ